MSILQNAVDSMELGVEDFQTKDPKRLPSAVRNFFAGVLLLFKHRLAELSGSDESLIKEKVVPTLEDGKVVWRGTGKKTVTVDQIKDRFKGLGIVVDWTELDKLQAYRNEIEHYHSSVRPEVVQQYLVRAFVVVRDFIDDVLRLSPRDLLGEKTWDALVELEEVYKAERDACSRKMDEITWSNETAQLWITSATCNKCGSDLVKPTADSALEDEDAEFECSACGERWSRIDLLKVCGSPHHSHRSIMEGGEDPVGICPQCGNEGYDTVEQQCAFCGERGPYECVRCGNEIPAGELSYDDGDLCGFCAHMTSKDD